MSRFDDMASNDLGRLIEDGSDLGVDGSCRAAEGGKSVEIRIVFGDDANGMLTITEGTTNNLTAPATTRRSVIIEAFGRDVQIDDLIDIPTGAKAGTWRIVAPPQLDDGDGAGLSLRNESILSAGRSAS